MNILICDDKIDDALELKAMISEVYSDANIVISSTASDALSYIGQGRMPNVCFLDIIMPGMDGLSIAEEMRKNGYNGHIVFLTVSRDFAIQSYKVKAFSYLLKPTDKAEVLKVLQQLREEYRAANAQGIPIKTKKITGFVLFKDLSHVEVSSHRVYFRLINGEEIVVNSAFSEIAPKLLEDSRFVQCHGSFVINMDEIKTISGAVIVMRSGAKIPVSKRFFHVKDKMIKWMFEDDKNL